MKVSITSSSYASPGSKPRQRKGREIMRGSPTGVIEETLRTNITSSSESSSDEDVSLVASPTPSTTADIHSKDDDSKSAIRKLFTSKEESRILHAHKILGISALVSFIYRFSNIGERDGNFGPNYGTLFFIFHHWFLNVSSFIFKIPQRRIRDGGFRIWPEYRIHSLVFASRGLACMLLVWYEQMTSTNATEQYQPYYFMDLGIVLATMAAADYGSRLQGEHRSNSIRGTSYSDPYGHWWASECQFALTAACLIGMRRYSIHLGAVMIIQCNSFLMTLRRKNVASHEFLTATYGALLMLGLVVAVLDDDYNDCMLPAGTYGNIAVLLRMGPLHVNKYALWTILFLSMQLIRNYTQAQILNNHFWVYAFIVTKICATGLGLKKRSEKLAQTGKSSVPRMVLAVMVGHVLLFAHIYYLNFILGEEE